MLPAGRRDRRIEFQAGTQVLDPESGAVSYTWALYFRCWAEREDLRGQELYRAQALAAHITTRYRVPYPHGMDVTPRESLRIVDQGRLYDLVYVVELGKRGRTGLEIYAEARAEQDQAVA